MNTTPDLTNAPWHKSTYSGAEGNCIEVAPVQGIVATRDSKVDGGPALIFSATQWTGFLQGVTGGEFSA